MHVFTCSGCAASWFPLKLRCPACGGGDLALTPVTEVLVEEVTADPLRGTWLATVLARQGPRLIARVPAGTAVRSRLPVVDSASAAADGAGAFAG